MFNQTIPNSNNDDWGFSIIRDYADIAQAWPLAVFKLQACTGNSVYGVRDFLDSRQGRHFADDVISNLHKGLPLDKALDAAIYRWMGWRISRAMEREYGIPFGLTYLTGLVCHHDINSENAV